MSVVFNGVLLAGSLIFIRICYLLLLHPLARYPGPFWAKLTYFWRVRSFLKGEQHNVDLQLHQRYGKFVRDGPDSLLISDIEAFKAVYGFTGAVEKGDFYRIMSNGKPHDPNVFAARTEVLHREAKRKLVSTALTPKHIAQYDESITKNATAFRQKIHEAVKNRGAGRSINIAPYIERYVFDAVLEVVFGSNMGFIEANHDKYGLLAQKKKRWPFTITISSVPWLARFMSQPRIGAYFRKPRLDKDGQPIGLTAAGFFARSAVSAATSGTPTPSPSILKCLSEVPPSDNRRLSKEMIFSETFNAIFAGTGSTTGALTAVVYELARHPELQSELYKSLVSSRGSDPSDSSSFPSYSALKEISVLQALIRESLRLHPPQSGPFERVIPPSSTSPTTIPNIPTPLPPGTRLWSSQYVILRSREIFGDDADEFRVERWLPGEGGPQKREAVKKMEDIWNVFGRGSRTCLGRDVTWSVIEKGIAALLLNYEMSGKEEGLKVKNAFEMQYEELSVVFMPRV